MLSRLVLCALMVASLASSQATAETGKSCVASGASSVQLVILASPEKVKAYAATIKKVPVVRSDQTTVAFDDGRVITSDVAAAEEHLNALGWARLPIRVVASFAQAAPPRRRGGG